MRLLAGLAMLAVVASAQNKEDLPIPTQLPITPPKPDALTYHGCYSSPGELTVPDDVPGFKSTKVSTGYCQNTVCKGYPVFATKGDQCYCGDKYPAEATLVDESKCNYNCPAYPFEVCGGIEGGKFWSVFNTGLQVDVENADSSAASTEGPDRTTATIEPTETATQSSEPKGSSNVAGIAAGVVVGVVAVAGIIGGVFWHLRRKRNQEIEEEHRRNAAVNSFMGHKPGSSGGLSMTDSRMDPVMAHRRLSDGSIADNQDYSRKILRVTNA